jgi:nitronate monooxygenase
MTTPTASFSTPLSRRLGLRYPIVAAPMFLISGKELIVAAAEAGIVGAMPSLNARTSAELKADLEWIRARTDKPFAINVTIGLTSPERLEEDVQLLMDFEVPIIITSYGDPTAVVARAHEKGSCVMHDVIHLKHAQKAQAAGVDAIIGVGAGAGGHAGRISPYALIPWLKDNLEVPIVAAGCISTGKQMAASFALGAELCYLGTRFIASSECRAVEAYKQMVVDAGPDDIVYTDAVSGIHANFLKQTIPDATVASRGPDAAKRWRDIWSAGQGVVEVKDIKPVAQIVDDLVREYHDAKASLP